MNSLEYYRVECPKCHGPLNSTAPLSGGTACPFCGTVYHITANMTKEAEMPEQIVPFFTLSDDFVQSAREMLLNEEYAPAHISGLISFKGAKGVYLPVYLYEGKYECSWSCEVKQAAADAGERKDTARRVTVYHPQNGVSKGEYAIVCLACDGIDSGKKLAEYVRGLDFSGDSIKPFLPDDLNDRFFLTRNRDSQYTWEKQGKDTLNNTIRKNALMQFPDNEIKNFKYHITSDPLSEGRLIYFPIWMVNYLYDGESHHIFMDGTGRNGVKGTTLIDRALKEKAENPFKILKYIAVAAIVIPLLMLLAGWYLQAIIALLAMGLVFFGYRNYARRHKDRVIRKARKEREKFLIRNS
jgi:hypothetical protein